LWCTRYFPPLEKKMTIKVLHFLPGVLATWLTLAVPSAGAELITLQTQWFRLQIGADGNVASLVDLRDRKDHMAEGPQAFASLLRAGRRHEASSVRREGDLLRVSFAETDVTATLRVQQKPEWIIFELIGLSDETDVEEVVFPHLRVSMPPPDRIIGVKAGCVRTERFAVCCQTLNLRTESLVRPAGRETVLMGRCYPRFGMKAARVSLFAAPSDKILGVIESLEVAENLPHPTLDGVWARASPDSRKSYLFIDMTEANADEIIRIARELNFGYILIYANTWARTLGSYEINLQTYPHGPDGLRAVVQKAHDAGLKVGIHCLTGFVSKRDPLATPVPDPRLAKDGSVTLAADIDDKATFIPTVESPQDFPDDIGYGQERQGFDVQIGDEIITYRGLATEPPFGLQRCVRGAHGTKRAAHKKGAAVRHLTQRYSNYLVDCDTDLADQTARRYAEVINTCRLDMIYFDGAGSSIAFGRQWAWRYVPQIPLVSERLWNREVRVGGSCSGPLFWHLKSFQTCNDFVEIGVKRFFDHDKVRAGRGAIVNFTPVDFGWWGLHTWAPHRRSTTPDEIEYVCQKALAFDAFWSLETTLKKIKDCGRWEDIKKTIAAYERLRLADYFPDRVKKAMQQDGAEFTLAGSDADGWQMVPVHRGPPHLVLDEKSSSWTVYNDLGVQPLRFRLYALPTLSSCDSDDNRVLLDQGDISRYVKSRAQTQCRTTLLPSDQRTPAGEACVAFQAASGLGNADGWVEHRADLVGAGRGTVRPALVEGLPEDAYEGKGWFRPLGVWVHGDGRGEVLNVQLRAANGGYRDHYVDVDFTGWRYCELARPESDRVFEFNAGYSRKHAVRHFQYDNIRSVLVRYNSIPAKSEVRCLVGPVKALREHWLPVKDPSFTIGGDTIVFPCQLETEQYLEFSGDGNARLFDREGMEVREVTPRGTVPVLQQGANRITFRSVGGDEFSQRAAVTVVRNGRTPGGGR